MATAIEYALMAGSSYISTRDDVNQFPIPQGWAKVVNPDSYFRDPVSGFEAISFTNGTEIVISFAGTGPGAADWIHGNIPLASGNLSDQLRQAADYYLQVKAGAPAGATISFTGHSLGGGLASLMAVFFGESAFTFDQAPFRASAQGYANDFSSTTDSVAKNLRAYLADHTPVTSLAKLDAYIAALEIFDNPNPIAADTLAAREARVTDINVQGEILSSWLVPFSRIGSQTNIPDSANGVSGTDLHSQALLTAFLQSIPNAPAFKTLSDVTAKLPDLLKMIFDPQLFYYDPNNKDEPKENLLEHLVRHEAGVRDPATGATTIAADAMVTRFTADMWKLAQDGGLTLADNNLSRALTAFAMQKYYEETATSPGYKQELFSAITGGIRFDLQDIAATPEQAKGYGLYFDDYLDSAFTAEERSLIGILLPVLRDWYVQAGAAGMTAADSQNRGAFMLGGNGTDTLTGGTLDDLLIGNAGGDTLNGGSGADILLGGSGDDTLTGGEGADTLLGGANNDTLDGGEGNDLLNGGEGNDTYAFSGSHGTDIVTDSDGSGSIQADGQILTGGTQKLENIYQNEATGHTFVKLNGGNALAIVKEGVSGRIVVTGWSEAKSLGIGLQGNAPAAPAPTLSGDFKKKIDDHNPADPDDDTYVMTDGNYTPDGSEPGALDLITGTAGKDVIYGLGGDDALSGMAGDDHIEGGDGGDEIQGGMGKDTLNGGAGDDYIYGASDELILKPGNVNFTKPVNSFAHPQATGFNWKTGYNTTFGNGVPDTYSNAPRNRLEGDQGNIIDGGAGNDFIAAGTGADYVHGGADKDFIYGMGKDDVLFGDGDNDLIYGDGDKPSPDSVVWALPEDHGNDILDGGDGDDYLYGQGKDDVIFGGKNNDRIWGDEVTLADLDPAYHGNDYLDGGDGNDQIVGGGKDDILIGGDGSDNMWGDDEESNLPKASHGNDYLYGGIGTDYLAGGAGNDYLGGGDDGDTLIGGEGKDILVGGKGVDEMFGDAGNDTLDGGADDDKLWGGADNDILNGGEGNGSDYLDGEGGDDALSGGDGSDTLIGGEGNDHLAGGAGADVLVGSAGNDTYVADNADTVVDEEGKNTIAFSGGMSSGNLMLSQSVGIGGYAYLVVEDTASGERVNFLGSAFDYAFNDGTTLDHEQLMATAQSVSLTLEGTAGDDSLIGGRADDILRGKAGADILKGGDGSDTLDGGEGMDYLLGGAGGDTYLFAAGDGADTVEDDQGADVIRFGDGITPDNIGVIAYNGGYGTADLMIRYNNGADAVIIQNGALGERRSWQFADGTVLGQAELMQRAQALNLTGSTGADTMFGSNHADVLSGLTGDDRIAGGAGADVLFGDAGNDSLEGSAGDDELHGGDGSDVLLGGAGDDTLVGGAGDDIYRVNLGDGKDYIVDDAGIDTIQFGDGIASTNLVLSQFIGDDGAIWLDIAYAPGESVAVRNGELGRIQTFHFADGTTLGWNDLLANAPALQMTGTPDADTILGSGQDDTLDGGAGADTLSGSAGSDSLFGGTGDDAIDGGSGDDVLNGGLGNDLLAGGAGSDAYVISWGMGQDTVVDGSPETGTVKLDAGVEVSALTARREENDLWIGFRHSEEGMRIKDYYSQPQNWQVMAGDGSVQGMGDFIAASQQQVATDWVQAERDRYRAKVRAMHRAVLAQQGYTPDANGNMQQESSQISDYYTSHTRTVEHYSEDARTADDAEIQTQTRYSSAEISHTSSTESTAVRAASLRGDRLALGSGGGGGAPQFYPSGGNSGIRIPYGSTVMQVTAPAYGSGGSYGGGSSYGGQSGALLGIWVYPSGYFNNGGTGGEGSTQYRTVTHHRYEYRADFVVEMLAAGASDNRILVSGYTAVDAGAGDDVIDGDTGWSDHYHDLPDGIGSSGELGSFLYGNAGNDRITGSRFADVLAGGEGDDTVDGSWDSDVYLVQRDGNGSDVIFDTGTSFDYEWFGPNTDTVEFAEGIKLSDLTISWGEVAAFSQTDQALETYTTLDLAWAGGNGARIVMPHTEEADYGRGIEQFRFADGAVLSMQDMLALAPPPPTMDPHYLDNVIDGTRDGDTIAGAGGDDVLDGKAGNDTLRGGEGVDIVRGGGGDDVLENWEGGDSMEGGAGADTLLSQSEPAFLAGGTGDDYLDLFGSNCSVIAFNRGDGADTVAWLQMPTTFSFGGGIRLPEVGLRRDGNDLVVEAGAGDSIRLSGWYEVDAISRPSLRLQMIDGTVRAYDLTAIAAEYDAIWLQGQVQGAWPIAGVASGCEDALEANHAWGGDLAKVYAESGSTESLGTTAIQTVLRDPAFGSDAQLLGQAAQGVITGSPGNDVLAGTSGNDTLTGGAGDDVYVFSPGFGNDVVVDQDAAVDNQDTIRFGDGISPAGVILSRSDMNLVLMAGADSITVPNWFLDDTNKIERIEFVDGTTWNTADIRQMTNLAPLAVAAIPGQSTAQGSQLLFTIAPDAFADGDAILGDTLAYGATLENGSPLPAWLAFDAQTRTLSGTPGNDDVGNLAVKITATDLAGATATTQFNLAVANINDAPVAAAPVAAQTAIQGQAFQLAVPAGAFVDIDPGDTLSYGVTLANGSPLPPWLAFNAQSRTLSGTPGSTDVGNLAVKLTASDNAGATASQTFSLTINAAPGIIGTAGNDYINGTDGGDDTISSLGGNDTLFGYAGNDTLNGGAGTDVLNGGAGNDIYLFGRGSGQDIINDNDAGAGNINTIRLAADVLPGDVTLTREDGSGVTLSINGTTDKLKLTNWFNGAFYQAEKIEFADGTVWNASVLSAAPWGTIPALTGTEYSDYLTGTDGGDDTISGLGGNDQLFGYGGNDALNGGAGTDVLTGGIGNDVLDGGTGNDTLNGGTGNDIYLFGRGSGQDIINDNDAGAGNINTIRLAADVLPGDVTLTREDGSGVTLSINGTTDKLKLTNWFNGAFYQAEKIEFADGTVWNASALSAAPWGTIPALTGTEYSDYLTGTDGGADTISGLGGNDSLYGYAGNDVLDGGAGNDYLSGGYGNDTYLFGRGAGQDAVTDYDPTFGNTDQAQFGANISLDQLWFRHVGSNLEVSIIGTADKLTLNNWYTAAGYHVEQFKTADSKLLLDSQVENLVSAMAAFAPPASGQTTLPQNYQDALAPVLAANWH